MKKEGIMRLVLTGIPVLMAAGFLSSWTGMFTEAASSGQKNTTGNYEYISLYDEDSVLENATHVEKGENIRLLVFTKSGCSNCSAVMRQLNKSSLLSDSEVDVVIGHFGLGNDKAQTAISEMDAWPNLKDRVYFGGYISNSMWDLLGIVAPQQNSVTTPVLFILDQDDRIRYWFSGWVDISGVEKKIKALKEEKETPPGTTDPGEKETPPGTTDPGEKETPPAPTGPEEKETPPGTTDSGEKETPPAPTAPEEKESTPAPTDPEGKESTPAPTVPEEKESTPAPENSSGSENGKKDDASKNQGSGDQSGSASGSSGGGSSSGGSHSSSGGSGRSSGSSIGYTTARQSGSWQLDQIGWWYKTAANSYAAGEWREINGKWYYFDNTGYMATGWRLLNNKWYYLEGDGSMATGWRLLNDKWYYMKEDGSMATGWIYSNGIWYYLNSAGDMAAGAQVTVDGKGYQFDGEGKCLNPYI